jgi:hypothetical protein
MTMVGFAVTWNRKWRRNRMKTLDSGLTIRLPDRSSRPKGCRAAIESRR